MPSPYRTFEPDQEAFMSNFQYFFRDLWTVINQEYDANQIASTNSQTLLENYHDDVYKAVVTQTIKPGKVGQVRFQGSWWSARCTDDVILGLGEVVYVIQRHNNTLYVEPGVSLRSRQPLLTTVSKSVIEDDRDKTTPWGTVSGNSFI